MALNLKTLDFKTAGFWPKATQQVAYGVAFSVILILGYVLLVSGKYGEVKRLAQEEATLREEFKTVQGKANNLADLKTDLAQINSLLRTLITRLPNQNEIPALVVNVSQAAIANGLQVDMFEPQDEVKKDFYAEKRINVNLKGDYHQLGSFFSAVAQQPRLIAVVVDDMKTTITPPSKKDKAEENTDTALVAGKPPALTFEGTVRTYRYLSEAEEQEIADAKAAEEKKKKKKSKKDDKKDDDKAA